MVPFEAAGFEHAPVLGLQAPAVWHWSLAVQVTWPAAVQTPVWQESFKSQALPSLHAVPFGAVGFEHNPVVGLQTPATWQASLAPQRTVTPAVQMPVWHVSFESHALPSLHTVPLLTAAYCVVLTAGWHVSHVLAPFVAPEATHAPLIEQKPALRVGAEHTPVEALHVPGLWQESGAVQITWLAAVQTPDWHESFRSHAFPSLQLVPFARLGLEQTPVAVAQTPIP